MKVIILKSVLENILTNATPFLEKKDLSQITSHFYLNAEEDCLQIKSTDFEIGLSFSSQNVTIVNKGVATANGKKLLDIVKTFKDENVTLETINNDLFVKQNNSKFKLPMMNALEFPKFPIVENQSKFDIDSAEFIKAIKKVTPVIDNNNPKYELNGALISIKSDHINLVSTDTKRLALFKIEKNTEKDFSLIIPKKAILEIQKLFFNKMEIFYDENILIIKSEDFLFFTKLINGRFPEYERIIPKELKYRIQLSREKMVESIRQISILSSEIKIIFKSKSIIFESLNDDNSEGKTEIDFETGLEEDIYFMMNSRYILDFLSNIEENNFILGYNDSNVPFMLESQNLITIIMPIIK
ncbi:MAG: DNA polymerase III subunit beta [Campylobacteraceae bacterium]|nr:DNA polymerase III subunit beta [Campylobacteraceae bacterium]